MKNRPGNKSIRPWAVVFWLLVWQGGSMALSAAYPHGHLLLASPVSALVRLGELAGTANFWRTIFISASHIFGGFLLSCALGVVLAAAAARFPLLRELLSPLVAVVKAVPVVSFIILALVWLQAETLSLVIAALMVFPPVYLNVLAKKSGGNTVQVKMSREQMARYLCVNRSALSNELNKMKREGIIDFHRGTFRILTCPDGELP